MELITTARAPAGQHRASIETNPLHLGPISQIERINSHPCGVAYPILESPGALSATRIRLSQLAGLDDTRA